MQLSLAGWSLNRLFNREGNPLKLLEFPAFAKNEFGIDAVELNNIYFESIDPEYIDRLNAAADAAGSKLLNIAVDVKGDLSAFNESARLQAVDLYADWIPIAAELGCTAIRANSGGREIGDRREDAITACIDSFRRLADVGMKHEVSILIENHWGISSDPDVMTRIVRGVRETHGEQSMFTLVDFGNWPDDIERYSAIQKTMPFAAAVHAKVNDIDEQLNHPRFDHARCIAIARQAGYDGYLGIEYEGADDPVVGVTRGATLLRRLLDA